MELAVVAGLSVVVEMVLRPGADRPIVVEVDGASTSELERTTRAADVVEASDGSVDEMVAVVLVARVVCVAAVEVGVLDAAASASLIERSSVFAGPVSSEAVAAGASLVADRELDPAASISLASVVAVRGSVTVGAVGRTLGPPTIRPRRESGSGSPSSRARIVVFWSPRATADIPPTVRSATTTTSASRKAIVGLRTVRVSTRMSRSTHLVTRSQCI